MKIIYMRHQFVHSLVHNKSVDISNSTAIIQLLDALPIQLVSTRVGAVIISRLSSRRLEEDMRSPKASCWLFRFHLRPLVVTLPTGPNNGISPIDGPKFMCYYVREYLCQFNYYFVGQLIQSLEPAGSKMCKFTR